MGNLASTSRMSSAVVADWRVDAVEKQQESIWTRSVAWVATAITSAKAAVFREDEPEALPMAALYDNCNLLALARPDLWELCVDVAKDDDCESCTTDATDALTESESESDSEDEQEADDCFFDAVSDVACVVTPTSSSVDSSSEDESGANGCECRRDALIDRLHCLAASPSPTARSLLFLDDYMCPCGDCPNAKRIARDVSTSGLSTSEQHERSLTRLLQAFATYNEVIGYDREMLAAASECLHMWGGAENHAFTSFVLLFE